MADSQLEYSRIRPPFKPEESLPHRSKNTGVPMKKACPLALGYECVLDLWGGTLSSWSPHVLPRTHNVSGRASKKHAPVAWGVSCSWSPYDLSVLRACDIHVARRTDTILLLYLNVAGLRNPPYIHIHTYIHISISLSLNIYLYLYIYIHIMCV